jgi:hypothetical protein
MGSGWTNKGYDIVLGTAIADDAAKEPAGNWFFMLSADTTDTDFEIYDTADDYTETSGGTPGGVGNDYNAVEITRSTGITVGKNDTTDYGYATFPQIQFTMINSVTGVYFLLCCDQQPSGDLAGTNVIGWFDLGGPLSISAAQTLTITNAQMRIRKTAP